MRRMAATIRGVYPELGELAIWYDANDNSSVLIDGSNNVTQINNKGTVPNGEMVFNGGVATYVNSAINGKNVVRGGGTDGMAFVMANANKEDYKFTHNVNYTLYQVVKIASNSNRLMEIIGNASSDSQIGFQNFYENRTIVGFSNAWRKGVSGGNNVAFHTLESGDFPQQATECLVNTISSTASNIYNEKTLLDSKTVSTGNISTNVSSLRLGIGNVISSAKLLGDLCEIRIYKQSHNIEQREFVTDQLINKWGIS